MTYQDVTQRAEGVSTDGGLEKATVEKFDDIALLSAIGYCADARNAFDNLTPAEKDVFRRSYHLVAAQLKI